MILVDTGPLVALLHREDAHHEACTEVLRDLNEPLVTIWPVLTEAMFLLDFSPAARRNLIALLRRAPIPFAALGPDDLPRIDALLWKYRDLPMDLADAALVRVAERDRIPTIFTIDRRDFGLYRPKGLKPFTLIP